MKRSLLIAAVVAGTGAGCFGTTVQPGAVGVTYQALGSGLQKEVKTEGFYFQWPWNDVYKYSVQWQSRTEKVEILTADALHISTQVTVTYRPMRDQIYRLQTEIGRNYYEQVIQPAFLTLTRSEFAKHEHNALGARGPAIEAAVLADLRKAIGTKPLEIDRVSISHIEYDQALTRTISEKLSAVQKVEQKESELKIAERDAEIARTAARGRSDARRIEAEGQSAATELEAEGRAKAIVLEGDAQAKAQAAITQTLTAAYLRYKAFDNDATRYYFVPVGKDGMPIIVDTGDGSKRLPDAGIGTTRTARRGR